MSLILKRKILTEVVGKSFYDTHLPDALRQAKKYADEKGYVASMPQLLHGRVVAPIDNEITTNWFVALSEENVGPTLYGGHVMVAVHGGGILTADRIEQAYEEGLTPEHAARLTALEFDALLKGKLPGEIDIPLIPLAEFKQGVKDLPMRYAVVMDLKLAQQSKSGFQKIDNLYTDDLFIVRSGGVEQAHQYLDWGKETFDIKWLGNLHPFNSINPDQRQGRLLFLGSITGDGLLGDCDLYYDARFCGIASEVPKNEEKAVVQRNKSLSQHLSKS